MTVKVLFFASLRERLGAAGVGLGDVPEPPTVSGVWRQVAGGVGGDMNGANVLAAVNHEYAAPDTPVKDGDEVAFFPPVTGG